MHLEKISRISYLFITFFSKEFFQYVIVIASVVIFLTEILKMLRFFIHYSNISYDLIELRRNNKMRK